MGCLVLALFRGGVMLYVRYMPMHINIAARLCDAVLPLDEPRTAANIMAIKADLAEKFKEAWPSTRVDGPLEITLHHWQQLDG